jgi:D-serine deaminase-like pyridoxal phosphate-dependent protein
MTSRDDLETPSLVFDLDVVDRNVEEMATVAREAGVGLRPHTKTHKSPEIARRQVAAGARGITVAKLGEAEVMADAGLDDILIAYPIWGPTKLARLRALMERVSLRVSLDSLEVAEAVGTVGLDLGRPVDVLVEVDTGLHRLGAPPGDASARLALTIDGAPGVRVIGFLTHAGHAYRAADPRELEAAARREALDLLESAEACARLGLELDVISVGSTPTARVAARVPGVTEIRPGTYVFNDVQQMRLGVADESSCGARILATVISTPSDGRFVLDAGSKSLGGDGGDGPPFPGRGVIAGRPDLRLEFLSEEHGVGSTHGPDRVRIGDRLEVIPLHACTCVNLFDVAIGVRGNDVVEALPIAGRGKVA